MPVDTTHHELHDIWSRLTFDITWKILWQLDQHDIIEMMAVCRTWYEIVPQYSTRLFRRVTISGREQRLGLQKRKSKCLGPHVKTVVVVFHMGDAAFREDIEQLEQLTGGSCTTAVFCYCSSYQVDGFLATIRLLGNHLTRLIISHHLTRNVDFYDLMDACPQLTCLEIEQPGTLVSQHIPGDQERVYPRLTELLLFGALSPGFQLEAVLARCPNLRFLAFTGSMWYSESRRRELYTLLQHCTKLNYVSLVDDTALKATEDELDHIINRADEKDTKQHMLYELKVDLGNNSIIAVDTSRTIAENFCTLQSLKLHQCIFRRDLLQDETSCLTTLELRNMLCNVNDMIALISKCPLLEYVLIDEPRNSFTPQLVGALGNLLHLQHLYLIPNNTNGLDAPRTFYDVFDILFHTMQSNHIRLCTLHIIGRDAPIDDIILEKIGFYLSSCDATIQHLAISSPYSTYQGLDTFITRIKHFNHLLSLQLHHFEVMISEAALSLITELPVLEKLVLMSCFNVSGHGLLSLVQRANKLKSIHVQQCSFPDVAPWIEAAEDRLGPSCVYVKDIVFAQPPLGFRDWLF
ncbi:hypothetical protein K492DRAFT_177532 [Lichtheimia hyalospora FSU 10163]|nr:hypothetical protein K492DRAFT_177532 [Lichtheimia hyalospora FSU 10163]